MNNLVFVLKSQHLVVRIMSKKKNTIDEFIEWQNHQFDPGHYLGSKMHPTTRAGGNPSREAIMWFVGAGIFVLFYVVLLVQTLNGTSMNVWNDRLLSKAEFIIPLTIVFALWIAFCVWIGFRYRRKAQRQKTERKMVAQSRKRKKRH